jgi:hypothetical protein
MSPLPVGVTATYINAAAPGPAGEIVFYVAGIGPGGFGASDTLVQVDSVSKARLWFGDSQGAEAASEYYDRQALLRRNTELWALGLDTTGWTPNTWTLTYGASTTTASGTQWLRHGPYAVAISFAKGLDETAQAEATVAAVNLAAIPMTASNLLGVVTLTSKHVGVSSGRVSTTLNAFTGEDGVAGSLPVLVNNVDATGEPAMLTAAQVSEIRKLAGPVYWAQIDRGATWVGDLDDELEAGWGDVPGSGFNRYAHMFHAVATDDEATFTTFAAKNLRRHSFLAIGDAMAYELSASIAAIATVVRERQRPNPRTESGTLKNPGMVNVPIEGLRPGALMFDASLIRAAGGVTVTNVNGAAIASRMVSNRIKNDLNQPDLSEYHLSGILARRELLERILLVMQGYQGAAIVTDAGPSDLPSFVSEREIRDAVATLLVELLSEGIVYASSPAAARELVLSVTKTVDVNIADGWLIALTHPIPQITDRLQAVSYTTPAS